ncbi:MAG: hypothetical protein N2505_01945 [Endomicrobia bacterium]|nr:hypothetical protein [Endomicrobiia bacterium]
MKNLIKILLYSFDTCQNIICIIFKKLLKIFTSTQKKNYYESFADIKQKYCEHKKISKLSSNKFYCSECGKIIYLMPQEISILCGLLGVVVFGSIIYILTKRD